MALRIGILVPVIGAIVAGLSTLVSGLFAVGAAAMQASAALVVIPSLLSAIVQGAAGMLVAFGGVGKAVSAGLKPATQTAAQKAKEQIGLQRRLRDAHQAVGDAAYNSAQSLRAAQERVLDADKQIVVSHQAVRVAEEALAAARKAAREELIDLQFAAEGGALAEERAKMTLEQALRNLAMVRDLPPDNRLRRDAELSYKEADLNLRQIKERNGDIVQEQKKAKKEGINGQQAVIDAQKNLKAAHEGVRDAIEQQREAQEALIHTQKTNARSMRDAQEALGDAQQAMNEFSKAGTGAAGGVDQFAQSMKNLSPQAQSFVKYIISLHGEFLKLRAAAGREMFPKLEESLGLLVKDLFPQLRVVLRESGSAMGDATKSISEALTSGPFTSAFGKVAENNNQTIRRLGKVFGSLAIAFVNVLDAARPLISEFTAWMVDWAKRVEIFTVTKNKSGELTDSFDKAGRMAKLLIRIFKNIVEGVRDFGRIAAPEGKRLLKVFEGVTEGFANFTDTKENRKELREFFGDVGRNFQTVSDLIGELGKAFLRLGAIKGVDTTAKALLTTVPLLEEALGGTIEALGPQLVEVLNAIIYAFNGFSQSGGLEIALGIFRDFFTILGDIMGGPAGPVLGKLLGFLAALKAIQIIRGFPGIKLLDKGIVGIGKSIGRSSWARDLTFKMRHSMLGMKAQLTDGTYKLANKMKSGMSSVVSAVADSAKAAGRAAKNVGSAIGTGLKSAGGAIKTGTTTALSGLRSGLSRVATLAADAGKSIGSKLAAGARGAAGGLAKAASATASLARSSAAAAAAGARATVTFLAQKTAMVASAVATKVAAAAQWLLNVAMTANPIGLIIAAIVILVGLFVLAYKKSEKFREIINGALRKIGEFFSKTFEALKDVAKKVLDRIVGFFVALPSRLSKGAGKLFGWLSEKLEAAFQWVKDWIVKIVEFYVNLPGRIARAAGNIFGWLYDKFRAVIDWLGEKIDGIVDFFRKLPGKLANLPNPFKFLTDAFKGILKGMQDLWNSLDLSFSFSVPDWVPKYGGKSYEVKDLFPDIHVFAHGGVVPATSGGVLGLLAEAGRSERVEPLDSSGLSRRDRAIIAEMIARTNMGGRGDHIEVHPAPGMNEVELADLVLRKKQFNRRLGK